MKSNFDKTFLNGNRLQKIRNASLVPPYLEKGPDGNMHSVPVSDCPKIFGQKTRFLLFDAVGWTLTLQVVSQTYTSATLLGQLFSVTESTKGITCIITQWTDEPTTLSLATNTNGGKFSVELISSVDGEFLIHTLPLGRYTLKTIWNEITVVVPCFEIMIG